jgi:DNA-binding CsgD family transcriptional regulator
MGPLVAIILIIISLVSGFYGIVLLGNLRKKYHFDYLNSFFYYQVFYFLFGLYGILGSLAMEKILLKFDISNTNIGGIALLFPLFGIPFIVAAWFLFIKVSSEIINKRVPQVVAIAYFVLATSVTLIFGLYMKRFPEIDSNDFSEKSRMVFYSIDLLVALYIFLILFIYSSKLKPVSHRKFLLRFALLALLLSVLRALSLQFSGNYTVIGIYFLVLFFSGNLVIILLTKVYLERTTIKETDVGCDSGNLYHQYAISNREKEIIEEICKGKTNQEIADALFISLQTVKDHTYNIFRKVNVKNRVQLTRIFGKQVLD